MTLQEAFERADFVEFLPNSHSIIIHFQNEAIQEEFYDMLKTECQLNEFSLEINVTSEKSVKLILNDSESNPVYTSAEMSCRKGFVEDFKKNDKEDQDIEVYSDIITLTDHSAIPGSHIWPKQQHDSQKPILRGYKIS